MAKTIITDLAEALISAAAGGGGPSVAITQVALGDGGGALYDPAFSQTSLRREKARVDILSRTLLSDTSWRVSAAFDASIDPFTVREIGFFDSENNLITVYAGSDMTERQAGGIDYLIDHVLDFSRAEAGLIIVNAPSDFDLEFQIAVTQELAAIRTHQLKQAI